MLLPFLYLIVIYIVPVIVLLIYSFWKLDPSYRLIPAWNLDQFARFFNSPVYPQTLLKSIIFAFQLCGFALIVSYPIAYYLSRLSNRFLKGILLFLIVIPSWTSSVIRTYSWIPVIGENGIINHLLLGSGIIEEPLMILFTQTSVLIALIHVYLPWMFIPIYASLEKINPRLIEMARSLGADRWQEFRRVILPLSVPGIMAGILLNLIPAIGEFVIPLILGGTKGMMYGNLVQMAFGKLDWPFGAALVFVLMIIVMAFFIIYSRIFKVEELWESL